MQEDGNDKIYEEKYHSTSFLFFFFEFIFW